MREDYELDRAARGLGEITKSAKGSARSAKRVAGKLIAAHPQAAANIRVDDYRALQSSQAAGRATRRAEQNAAQSERVKAERHRRVYDWAQGEAARIKGIKRRNIAIGAGVGGAGAAAGAGSYYVASGRRAS